MGVKSYTSCGYSFGYLVHSKIKFLSNIYSIFCATLILLCNMPVGILVLVIVCFDQCSLSEMSILSLFTSTV